MAEPVEVSGIYPHLAFFNDEGECGTGAVVPWAGKLWVITYSPHSPQGSSDRLYEISEDLELTVRPESIGGTPANRMIHRESRQLFIGPYAIDAEGKVRVIPFAKMPGRPTGNARHLSDPAGKIYYATMEEGLYEVDVKTLEVKERFADDQHQIGGGRRIEEPGRRLAGLPGYHGKGLYSGQGRLIYANNGEPSALARMRPDVPSGVLASWDGASEAWETIRRQQFTEVTGPGGIHGNEHPESDPVWAMGWDYRSLILMVLDGGKWSAFRLPKGSHSYDGAHGWNTEWPRIREIGEGERMLATMHGTFWSFPRGFRAGKTAGIVPRSNYLKVIGDFCRWQGKVVFGCDDTAKNEFLNKRKAKGEIAGPQSQSNLWFVEPGDLDRLGPAIGRGAVWMREEVEADVRSDPFLIAGYAKKGVHLVRGEKDPAATLVFEVDAAGDGLWRKVKEATLREPSMWVDLSDVKGEWVRVHSTERLTEATVSFSFMQPDSRSEEAERLFDGLAKAGDREVRGGLIRARGGNVRTLAMAAIGKDGSPLGAYELDEHLRLEPAKDPGLLEHTLEHTKIPVGVVSVDEASVVFVDDAGRRWRLPKGDEALEMPTGPGMGRAAREVATERDLFHAYGTFYELPAENAGGFAKLRPVSTHQRRVHDFCSYRGLFVMSGTVEGEGEGNPHLVRSADGKAALWVGAIDDIWKMGKPRGRGGPWKDTAVKAGQVSDPYLMTAYDRKSLELRSDRAVTVTAEVDISGDGQWVVYRRFELGAGKEVKHEFPGAFSAYWIRFVCDGEAKVSAWLDYR